MTTYVAFLRAINVGGHAVIRMTDLRGAFVAAGGANVRTFIASGNVVFDAPPESREMLFGRIGHRVSRLLGREAIICFRTLTGIRRLVRSDPFGDRGHEPAVKLYVAFLARTPRTPLQLPASLPEERLEAFGMRGRDVFIVSRRKPNGLYGFPNTFVEGLGLTATTRNWSTVTKILDFAARPAPPLRPLPPRARTPSGRPPAERRRRRGAAS